jgi:nucleoside-diphosphate-sugar epimerase
VNVVVTGVTGLIGRALALRLVELGHRVRGTTRSGASIPGVELVRHTLGGPIDPAIFAGAEAIVHCAHDFAPGHRRENVEGTIALDDGARAAGAVRRVFLSSYSAHSGASSEYASVKLALERHMLAQGAIVARAGLVIGPGGLFARLARTIERLPVLPLLDGGRKVIAVVAIADLVAAVCALVASGEPGAVNLASAERVTLLDLVREIEHARRRSPLHLPVPGKLLLRPLAFAERLGLRLPITQENLKGYLANDADIFASDLSRFVARPATLRAMIDRSQP